MNRIAPSSHRGRIAADKDWLRSLARSGGMFGRLSMILPLLGGALLLVQAAMLASILHRAVVGNEPLETLLVPTVLLAGLILARIVVGTVSETFAVRAGEAIKADVRDRLVRDLLGRRPVWTAARPSGALAGLVVEQVEALDGYFVRYMPAMVQTAILPLAFAVVVFPVDWVAGLLFLVTAPLIPVFMALAGWGAEAASKAQAGAMARLSGHFADRLRGIVTLKLFGQAEAEVASVHRASEDLRAHTMGVMRIAFLSSAVLEFFAALGVAGIALYVGLTFLDLVTLRGTPLTLEAGLFCLLMAPEVYQPLRLLAAHYHDKAAAKAAVAEIGRTLGAMPLPTVPAIPMRQRTFAPARPIGVTARNLSAATPDGRPVIVDANFEVLPGSHHAIVGESGSGKSTLLEAIAGVRDYSGGLTFDGRSCSEIDDGAFRHGIAVLGQRPRIFAGTIADNIRLGRPTACDTLVRVAARRACVDLFADSLPLGLDTPVGENGVGISGGEVQRVALARIYLRDPGLILLDEPTAHLDAITEAAVLDGLLEFAARRTLLVATHSPAVAGRMDRTWRIMAGRVLPAIVRAAQQRQLAERGAA